MDLRAFIFVPCLVGATIFGFLFLLFICHYYLTVLETSAAGGKEVAWVSEPVTDNFWKVFYLAWLVGLCAGPAVVIGRILSAGHDSTWAPRVAPLVVFWFCYPICQLSSLGAHSMWYPLTLNAFTRIAQKPFLLLQFFALSAIVLAACVFAFQWTFRTEGNWPLLFVGAPLLIILILLYARLLGRLAFLLSFTRDILTRKRKKKAKSDNAEATPAKRTTKRKPRIQQPSDLPPMQTPDGELAGYDVKLDDEPFPPTSPQKKRVRAERADASDDSLPEPGFGLEPLLEPESEIGLEPLSEPLPSRESPPLSQPLPPRRAATPQTTLEHSRVWTDEDDEETISYETKEAEVKTGASVPAELLKPSAEEMRLLTRSDSTRKPQHAWGAELFTFLTQPGPISAVVTASGLCVVFGSMVRLARAFNPMTGAE